MNNRGVFSNSRFYREARENRNAIINDLNQTAVEPIVEVAGEDLNNLEVLNETLSDEEMRDVFNNESDEEISEDEDYGDDFSTDEDNLSDDSEDEIDDGGREEVDTFKNKLAAFVRTFNLSCKGTKALLKLLRENGHFELPKNRETLLGTPTNSIQPRVCFPGQYYHFSLRECLLRSNFSFLDTIDVVRIDINIDGVSLSKCSRLKLWPILGAFVDEPNISPFLIGCYCGYADPKNTDDYIQEFVTEMREIMENGCNVTPREILKPVEIRTFTCDMPGRSFVKGVKGHQSKFGCDKCNQECKTIEGKMTYLTVTGEDRTDETFRNRTHIEHHQPQYLRMRSMLEELNLGMVSQFAIDDMHAIHLGKSLN